MPLAPQTAGATSASQPSRPRWRTAASAYSDDAWLAYQLARQASHNCRYDAKTCAALFLANHAPRVAMAIARQWVGRKLMPVVRPEQVWLAETRAFRLDHFRPTLARRLTITLDGDKTQAATPDALPLLREAIEAHFLPLIAGLCRHAGISSQALWRLVADAIAAAFLETGRRTGRESAAKADALALLKHAASPLANAQLHYFDITVADPVRGGQPFTYTFRQRGGCCRYYTAFPGQLCSTCVLKDPAERDRALEVRLLRHLTLRRFPERLYRNAKARLARCLHPGSNTSGTGL